MGNLKWWAVSLFAVAGLAVGLQFVPAPVDSSDWASWAQAVGTIVAIAVTARLAFIPLQAETRRRRQGKADFINMVTDAIDYAFFNADDLIRAVEANDRENLSPGVNAWHESFADRALGELREIPLSNWPSAIFNTRVHRLILALRELVTHVHHSIATWHAEPQHSLRALKLAKQLRERETEYRQSLAGLTLD